MTDNREATRDIFDSGIRGLRHGGVRRANEKAVLTVVAFNAGVSNADISRLSGLAPQTVSAILTDLERSGLIERGAVLRGRRGQPATPLQVRARGAFGIGIEMSWTHLDAVLLNMHAEVLAHRRLDYAFPDASTIIESMADIVAQLRAVLPEGDAERLVDIGLAMPGGMLDKLHLVDAPAEQVALWKTADPAALLQSATGLEVTILNDGNSACWSELIALDRPRPANVLYFLLSRYIAAGIIGDGALWEGATGNASNLGAMLVPVDGLASGQAHIVASVSALERRLAQTDADERDAVIDAWIGDSARALAHVAFNAMTVVDAPLLVIDTVLDREITLKLSERLEIELTRLPVGDFRPPRVMSGRYGKLAPAIGAAELPLYRRYF